MKLGIRLIVLFIIVAMFGSILNGAIASDTNSITENIVSTGTRGDLESDCSGIYYLHDDLPEHGQDIGNTHDVGDLLRIEPHGNEERYCAKWVQFDFDGHVLGELTGDDGLKISTIYYHIWWKSTTQVAEIGVEVHGLYDSSTDYSFTASFDNAISIVETNGYWLTTHLQEVDYFQEDIHDLAIKVVSIDAIPSVYSGLNQPSFIILNVDDDETLKFQDQDNDGLSDYDELFVYSTNPNNPDTDHDELDDWEEVINGTDGLITEPNNPDMDNDDLLDGNDPNPLSTQYRIIEEEWIISGNEVVKDDGLLVKNNITVLRGGSLSIENTVLKMNQNGEMNRIRVDEGGELSISNSKLTTDDPDHWYSMALNTEHWHDERSFEIYGKATLKNNIINYGSSIYIRYSNDTILQGNEILHYYYGVFSSYSSP